MAAEPPFWHAVPSRGRCQVGVGIFKAPGCILGHFWPIWLSVLAPLNKTFAA